MTTLETIPEIKAAVDANKDVRCGNDGYSVCKDSAGQYLIICSANGHTIGLTGREGTEYERILNGSNFYTRN